MSRQQGITHSVLVDMFMTDVKRYEVMTPEIELATLKAYKETGNEKYRNALIEHNMRFVMSVTSKYHRHGVSPLELVNVGAMGLAQAIEKYDMDSGKRLITVGVWWIKAYVSAYLRDNANPIRLPANQHLLLQKALRESTKNNVDLHEIASDEVCELFNLTQQGSSFSDPVGHDGDDSLTIEDTLADETDTPYDEMEKGSIHNSIIDALGNLPENQREIILLINGFAGGEKKTLKEVGAEIGLSYERVRQLRNKAYRSLKEDHPELEKLLGA